MIYNSCRDGFLIESIPLFEGRFITRSGVIDAHHFTQDHLGSVRVVVDELGTVLERNDYYPLGMRWSNDAQPISDNRYRYNGKENQEFAGTPYIDYGARQYDPYTGRWNAVDPLAEKYYPISPYAFCAGNPVKFIDVDGRKIYFAPGVSSEFKEKFAATVQYMNQKGTSGDIATLEDSKNVYLIGETGNTYDKSAFGTNGQGENLIIWDPNMLKSSDDGKILISPATVLAHEAGHAVQYDKNPSQYKQDKNTSDSQYSNKEERRNIISTEQNAAKKHGEISQGQTTRKNHKARNAGNVSNMKPQEIEDYVKQQNRLNLIIP